MDTQSHLDKINLKPNILPYGSHVGAPSFDLPDLTPFKRSSLQKSEKLFNTQYEDLLKRAEDLKISFIFNREIYESKYNFEPIVGEIYHLYENKNEEKFLSMIEPSSWNQKHICSARLNSDFIWEKIS